MTDQTPCCTPDDPCSADCAHDFTRTQELASGVLRAVHNGAQINWIQDYVEYYSEGHGGTFAEYLLFQVQQEEESPMEERQDAGGYLSRLLRYLHTHPSSSLGRALRTSGRKRVPTMNSSDRAVLWHDETVHPGSTAVTLAMRAVQADMGLVSEWQQHCQENYEAGDWISYFTFLEVELEMTLDHFVDVKVHDAVQLAHRVKTLVGEINKASGTASKILVKCTGQRYPTNPDDLSEPWDIMHKRPCPVHSRFPIPEDPVPLDVRVRIPGSFTAKLAVHEENVELQGWTFVPAASHAGFFGVPALVDDVLDADGEPVSEPESEGMRDFLNVEDTAGPFWRTIQEKLSERGAITVNWEE